MSSYLGCSFARVYLRVLAQQRLSVDDAFAKFTTHFGDFKKLQVDLDLFKKAWITINKSFNSWKKDEAKQHVYLASFGENIWEALPKTEKSLHRIASCRQCAVKHEHHRDFRNQPQDAKLACKEADDMRSALKQFFLCWKQNSSATELCDLLLSIANQSFSEVFKKDYFASLCMRSLSAGKENNIPPSRVKEKHQREFRREAETILHEKSLNTILATRQGMYDRIFTY